MLEGIPVVYEQILSSIPWFPERRCKPLDCFQQIQSSLMGAQHTRGARGLRAHLPPDGLKSCMLGDIT